MCVVSSSLNIVAILHSPTAVTFNNSKLRVEALITCTQLCDPLHGDHYITALMLSAEHLFFVVVFLKRPSHPFGLSITSTIIKLFVCVLVGGKLCDSL